MSGLGIKPFLVLLLETDLIATTGAWLSRDWRTAGELLELGFAAVIAMPLAALGLACWLSFTCPPSESSPVPCGTPGAR